MIGRKEWFTRRKYSGWGLTPRSKQGFIYVFVLIAIFYFLSILPLSFNIRMILISVMAFLLSVDILHIMASIKMDERETKIEAISERNASWTMVSSIALLLFYFGSSNFSLNSKEILPFIIFPLITGLIAKAATALILQKKDL